MTRIDLLNQRLGERLGLVCGGTKPRFQWMFGPDMPYWRARLGKVWVLCSWQKPVMSERDWLKNMGDRFPYPANGMWHPNSETKLPPGVEPTEALTQMIIATIDRQMSQTFADHLRNVNDEMAADQAAFDLEWVEKVQNSNPAFNNWDWGSRASSVSFGGV